MKHAGEILQIVPRAPGSHEGVGDYALLLAGGLEKKLDCLTTFVAAQSVAGPNILAPLAQISEEEWRQHSAAAIVLHYVSYGYHPRGVPFFLPAKIDAIRRLCGGRLVTIFHELFAAGSWRQSAFWLRPFQRRIVRSLARESQVCIVSSAILAEQLCEVAPRARVVVRPVVSTFGEPHLSIEQFADRDPERWVICGGTELIQRSLGSFPESFRNIQELFVIGGADLPEIRALFPAKEKIAIHYLPNVGPKVASEILATCTFGWLDYFAPGHFPNAAILKSTTFAAFCAHGVIPIFPRAGAPIALDDDLLPGPFTLETFPAASERPRIARAIYDWYHRNASSARLAETIAEAIGS
jgi:hypothetical protein